MEGEKYSRCSLKEKSNSMLVMLPQVATTLGGLWAEVGERREAGGVVERDRSY
jgi:hypothetical protein